MRLLEACTIIRSLYDYLEACTHSSPQSKAIGTLSNNFEFLRELAARLSGSVSRQHVPSNEHGDLTIFAAVSLLISAAILAAISEINARNPAAIAAKSSIIDQSFIGLNHVYR